jgi:hypothetical protein
VKAKAAEKVRLKAVEEERLRAEARKVCFFMYLENIRYLTDLDSYLIKLLIFYLHRRKVIGTPGRY